MRRILSSITHSLTLVALLAACGKDPPATTDPSAAAPAPAPATDAADAPTAAADLPPAEEVLEQAVVALGGRDKLDAVKSFYSESKMEIPAQKISAVVRTWWKDGDFYMENDMTGVGLSQVWKHGEDIWSQDPINGRRKLEGKEARQSMWGASVSLAADWKRYFQTAETVGRRAEGETELIDVKLTDADGTEVTLSFDATSHLPVEQSFTQETPMGNLPIRTTMEDYRDVAGVKTSFRSTTNMAVMSAVQTVEKFEPNVEVDEAKFVPPAAKTDKKAKAEAPKADKNAKAAKK